MPLLPDDLSELLDDPVGDLCNKCGMLLVLMAPPFCANFGLADLLAIIDAGGRGVGESPKSVGGAGVNPSLSKKFKKLSIQK